MDIDIYQQCPCHPEKKIKFCCGKEIVSDLNQVLNRNTSGQSHAALEHLDRVIEKLGPRDCLMAVKTHIHFTLNEFEQASTANDKFLEANPNHATGLQHKAMIAVADGRVDDAVELLQDAMDSITGADLPISLSHAFRLAGVGLLEIGDVLAARAHLRFAQFLKGDRDDELMTLEMETFRAPEISGFLKSEFELRDGPEDAEWNRHYVNVSRAMQRGQFRKALKMLKKIDEKFPGESLIARGFAIVNSIVGPRETQADAWRTYARMDDVDELDKIEAFGIAEQLETETASDPVKVLRKTFTIKDADHVAELLSSQSHCLVHGPLQQDPFGEGPAPKVRYDILNRDYVKTLAELDRTDVPRAVANAFVYGRQTDREPRLEMTGISGDDLDQAQQKLQTLFGDAITQGPTEQELELTERAAQVLMASWKMPEDINQQQYNELTSELFGRQFREQWTELSFRDLDGLTVREAAGKPELAPQLKAKFLAVSERFAHPAWRKQIDEVQQELGIDPIGNIDPARAESLSMMMQRFVDVKNLDDEGLLRLHSQAMAMKNESVLPLTTAEVLDRPQITDMPRDICHAILARHAESSEETLEHLAQARAEASKAGRSPGIYLVHELYYRVSSGMTEKVDSLLETIQTRHKDEEDVLFELQRVLQALGFHPNDDADFKDPNASPSLVTAPDSAAASEDDAPSKLWLPD